MAEHYSSGTRRQATEHPISVVAGVDFEGCAARGKRCKMWGCGVLRFVTGASEESYSGTIVLAAAGCEQCDNLTVTQGDIGVIPDGLVEGDVVLSRGHTLSQVREVAQRALAETVHGFVPSLSDQPDTPGDTAK